MGSTKKKSIKTRIVTGVELGTQELPSEKAISDTAEVLHALLISGINMMTLTTVDDELIRVRITPLGKARPHPEAKVE